MNPQDKKVIVSRFFKVIYKNIIKTGWPFYKRMSNFNVLACPALLGSFAPARRPHPPRLGLFFAGAKKIEY